MTIRANSSILGDPETHRSEEASALKATLANTHFMSMLTKAMKNVQPESAEVWTALIHDTQKTAAEDLTAQKMDYESKLNDVKKEYESKMRELLWDNKSKAIEIDVLRKFAEPSGEAKAMSLLASYKADMDVSDKKLGIDALKDNINALKDTIAALKDTVAALKDNIKTPKDTPIVPDSATEDLRETNEDLRKRNDELSAAYEDKKEQLRELDNKHREHLSLCKATKDKRTAAMDDLSASYDAKDAELEQLKKNYKQLEDDYKAEQVSIDRLQDNVNQRDKRIGWLKFKAKHRDATIDRLDAQVNQLGDDFTMPQQHVDIRDDEILYWRGPVQENDHYIEVLQKQVEDQDLDIENLREKLLACEWK